MLYRFKILQSEKESKFMGMFGDCIKIRLNHNDQIKPFLAKELGADEKLVEIVDENKRKNMVIVNLPDISYEIIMSWIE